jgi:hypothetical protein
LHNNFNIPYLQLIFILTSSLDKILGAVDKKMAKKKMIMHEVLSRLVVSAILMITILMITMPVTVSAVNGGYNTIDSATVIYLNDMEESVASSDSGNDTGDTILTLFSNDTPNNVSVIETTAGNTSGDCAPIPAGNMTVIDLNDTDVIILTEFSNGTDKTVSAMGGTVYLIIDDPCCKGYCVYVDAVYQFTEGQDGTPDGYCAFYVSGGTHTIKIKKDGHSASITKKFQCGYSYRWESMTHCWCQPECEAYIKIDDPCCKGYCLYVDEVYQFTEGQDGTPDGYCAFYVKEGTHTIKIKKNERYASISDNFQCGYSYRWESMPHCWCQPECEVYVIIDDDTCAGYQVYVDEVYKFREGEEGTPDGYCTFYVKEGTHTIMITKNGRSASITNNFQCDYTYQWDDIPNNWCNPCVNPPTVTFDKSEYYGGDIVQATVSTSHSPVYYEITDGDGAVRKAGYGGNGETISYTIPLCMPECNYWAICFYWSAGAEGTGGKETAKSFECYKCYSFFVCSNSCSDPPIVTFDKSEYNGGDTVHATILTIHSPVYYKIKDGNGTVRKTGYGSNEETISYTIPSGISECCDWTICF